MNAPPAWIKSLAEASTVFRDPLAITLEDIVHSSQEQRYLLIGVELRAHSCGSSHGTWLADSADQRATSHPEREESV
jgi:hypothetical protein